MLKIEMFDVKTTPIPVLKDAARLLVVLKPPYGTTHVAFWDVRQKCLFSEDGEINYKLTDVKLWAPTYKKTIEDITSSDKPAKIKKLTAKQLAAKAKRDAAIKLLIEDLAKLAAKKISIIKDMNKEEKELYNRLSKLDDEESTFYNFVSEEFEMFRSGFDLNEEDKDNSLHLLKEESKITYKYYVKNKHTYTDEG